MPNPFQWIFNPSKVKRQMSNEVATLLASNGFSIVSCNGSHDKKDCMIAVNINKIFPFGWFQKIEISTTIICKSPNSLEIGYMGDSAAETAASKIESLIKQEYPHIQTSIKQKGIMPLKAK